MHSVVPDSDEAIQLWSKGPECFASLNDDSISIHLTPGAEPTIFRKEGTISRRSTRYPAATSEKQLRMARDVPLTCQARSKSAGCFHERALRPYRRWPMPIPSVRAFCLIEPSVRFIALAIFFTGVLALECARNSFTCSLVYGTRVGFFAAFGTP
jgi:hypothetical protein